MFAENRRDYDINVSPLQLAEGCGADGENKEEDFVDKLSLRTQGYFRSGQPYFSSLESPIRWVPSSAHLRETSPICVHYDEGEQKPTVCSTNDVRAGEGG